MSYWQTRSSGLQIEMVSYRAQCHEQNGTIAAYQENQDIQNNRRDRLPSKHLGAVLLGTATDCAYVCRAEHLVCRGTSPSKMPPSTSCNHSSMG